MKTVFLFLSLILASCTCPDNESKETADSKQVSAQGVVADDTKKNIDEITDCHEAYFATGFSGVANEEDKKRYKGMDCLRADFDSNGVNDFYIDMTVYLLNKDWSVQKNLYTQLHSSKPELYTSDSVQGDCPVTKVTGIVFKGANSQADVYLYDAESKSLKHQTCTY